MLAPTEHQPLTQCHRQSGSQPNIIMTDKPPYGKWAGILLGFLLAGSAHYLSGRRRAGLMTERRGLRPAGRVERLVVETGADRGGVNG